MNVQKQFDKYYRQIRLLLIRKQCNLATAKALLNRLHRKLVSRINRDYDQRVKKALSYRASSSCPFCDSLNCKEKGAH